MPCRPLPASLQGVSLVQFLHLAGPRHKCQNNQHLAALFEECPKSGSYWDSRWSCEGSEEHSRPRNELHTLVEEVVLQATAHCTMRK